MCVLESLVLFTNISAQANGENETENLKLVEMAKIM